MTLPKLTVIPAGAGSGKTHTVTEMLGDWVRDRKVAPEKIVAVTFTNAAAGELRERISARLLADGRAEDALRLDQAYISTIHGFGLRILTEFAFEAGSSPHPRLLNEDEQGTLVRQSLAGTGKAADLMSDLHSFGYRYDWVRGGSAEDAFRDHILRMSELLRSLDWGGWSGAHAEHAVRWIKERYGPPGDGERMTAALEKAVKALLAAYPGGVAAELGELNRTARTELIRDHQNLGRAARNRSLSRDWRLWQSLRGLRLSKRGSTLPARYEELAGAVIEAAGALPGHPGPLEQAVRHATALVDASQDVLEAYAADKRGMGLVDYTDMIADAGRLLRSRPEVLKTLRRRVDCLVVDEFQDTNPLQFALLWELTAAGIPTVVVGDLKQAIMGFQGADPRLFDAMIRRTPAEELKPLDRNWRSQPPLMEFVNAVGPGLFGRGYTPLAPQRGNSLLAPLEFIAFPKLRREQRDASRAGCVGRRLGALLSDERQLVVDRRADEPRRLRGRDVAVLCPTNDMLAVYAEVFRCLGLKVRLEADGWLESRAVQLAWHALAYLANPADRHAALYLAVTELGSFRLEDALKALIEDGRIDEPLLARLDALAEGAAERTIYALVADVIDALGMLDAAAEWPGGEQARANLLLLLAEAGEFMDAKKEALASGGYHGSGIHTFLAWVQAKVERDRDNDRQPDPGVLDEDGVTLTTWHSAKGREWPVVAVCGASRAVKGRLPSMELGYSSFDDLSRLAERARIEFAPDFAAPETKKRFLEELDETARVEAKRLLYVAMTRARDKLVMEWPGHLEGRDTVTYWSLLRDACDLSRDGALAGGRTFPCHVETHDKPEPPSGYGRPAAGADAWRDGGRPPRVGRRAIRPGAVPEGLTPDGRTPSKHEPGGAGGKGKGLEVERYGDGLDIDVDMPAMALGAFLHRCFEILGPKPELKDAIPSITGVELEPDALERVAAAAGRFQAWLDGRFEGASVLREWPVLMLDGDGAVVSGVADLIVETPDGAWVIDLKSDQVDDPSGAFAGYRSQLRSYAAAVEGSGAPVLGTGICWIRRGEVVLEAR